MNLIWILSIRKTRKILKWGNLSGSVADVGIEILGGAEFKPGISRYQQ